MFLEKNFYIIKDYMLKDINFIKKSRNKIKIN